MAQEWSNKAKATALDAVAATATEMALYNGHPASGGVEITGGSYARQSLTWGAAPTDGSPLDSGQIVFNVAPATTFTHAVSFDGVGDWVTADSLGSITIDAAASGDQPFTLLSNELSLSDPA